MNQIPQMIVFLLENSFFQYDTVNLVPYKTVRIVDYISSNIVAFRYHKTTIRYIPSFNELFAISSQMEDSFCRFFIECPKCIIDTKLTGIFGMGI